MCLLRKEVQLFSKELWLKFLISKKNININISGFFSERIYISFAPAV